MRGLAITIVLITCATAHAGKSVLAGLAPASDARKAVAIGPAGQVYEPDGKGAWVRRRAGGTAVELVGATAIGGTPVAIAKNGTPFKLRSGAWSAIVIAPKQKPIVGAGPRLLAANGNDIYALDKTSPTKLTDAPARVTALAASASGAVLVTDKGLMRLEGAVWKPIKKAPKTVKALLTDRWAIVDKGVLDLKSLTTIAWPSGARITETTTVGNTVYAIAVHGTKVELLTLTSSKAKPAKPAKKGAAAATPSASFASEEIPLDDKVAIVGLVVDSAGRVVVAARDGKLALRAGGAGTAWTVVEVREELPPDKPGPPAAASAP